MKICENCGCKIYNGVCSNCYEELYIFENQNEFITEPLSDEFVEKVKKQKEQLEIEEFGRS